MANIQNELNRREPLGPQKSQGIFFDDMEPVLLSRFVTSVGSGDPSFLSAGGVLTSKSTTRVRWCFRRIASLADCVDSKGVFGFPRVIPTELFIPVLPSASRRPSVF